MMKSVIWSKIGDAPTVLSLTVKYIAGDMIILSGIKESLTSSYILPESST